MDHSRHHVGMAEPYNRFTGQSLERLTALSDGLFAVAMTLLVLDLRVPVSTAGSVYSERGLGGALLKLGPSFAAYLLSFTMLGTFWLAQHTLLSILGRCDRTLTWINLGFCSLCRCCRFPRCCSLTTSTCAWRWACTG
jgi:uncharacterized membrane protein